MKKWQILALTALLLGSCMVGPRYKPPENNVPDQWQGEVATEEPLTEWWEIFEDELLSRYIDMAASHNKEVLIAQANVLQARAVKMSVASSLFPQVSSDINATKTYFSKNGPVFAGSSFTAGTSSTTGLPFDIQVPQIQNLYNFLFDASWEIDLFGKTRRNVQAAKANIESAIEMRNDMLISVLAEIARGYMEIRSNQCQLALTKRAVELWERKEQIVRGQLERGLANSLDLETVLAQLSTARAALPDIHAQIIQGIYALSILTGNLPETLVDEMLPVKPLPTPPAQIAVGLRSELLRRRPDIRSAERQLASATASVGAAVASFYPSFTMIGDFGLQSLQIRDLFQTASRTWSLGGNMNTPLFQGGLLVGNLRSARAVASAALLSYEQTVLSALKEAEGGLVAYADDLETSRHYNDATEKNRTLLFLSTERYERGLVNLIDLISAEQQLIKAELLSLSSQTTALVDLISLYKALGGGWQSLKESE